jgi:hypothetical protein
VDAQQIWYTAPSALYHVVGAQQWQHAERVKLPLLQLLKISYSERPQQSSFWNELEKLLSEGGGVNVLQLYYIAMRIPLSVVAWEFMTVNCGRVNCPKSGCFVSTHVCGEYNSHIVCIVYVYTYIERCVQHGCSGRELCKSADLFCSRPMRYFGDAGINPFRLAGLIRDARAI